MTNKTDKIKKLLGEVIDLLTEKEAVESSVEITIPVTFTVKSHDEPTLMTWHEAMSKFGPNGSDPQWRLPTKDELHSMFKNKERIPNIKSKSWYWSSSEDSNYTFIAWIVRFSDALQNVNLKVNSCEVRCLRR